MFFSKLHKIFLVAAGPVCTTTLAQIGLNMQQHARTPVPGHSHASSEIINYSDFQSLDSRLN